MRDEHDSCPCDSLEQLAELEDELDECCEEESSLLDNPASFDDTDEDDDELVYDCAGCGAVGVIREDDERCPSCDAILDWEDADDEDEGDAA